MAGWSPGVGRIMAPEPKLCKIKLAFYILLGSVSGAGLWLGKGSEFVAHMVQGIWLRMQRSDFLDLFMIIVSSSGFPYTNCKTHLPTQSSVKP